MQQEQNFNLRSVEMLRLNSLNAAVRKAATDKIKESSAIQHQSDMKLKYEDLQTMKGQELNVYELLTPE